MGEAEDEAVFDWELMKLVIQVAWADDQVVDSERRFVRDLASHLSLTDAQRSELEACLEEGTPLPAPDLQLLRTRREDAFAAAQQIALADDELADDEAHMLSQLHELLGGAR